MKTLLKVLTPVAIAAMVVAGCEEKSPTAGSGTTGSSSVPGKAVDAAKGVAGAVADKSKEAAAVADGAMGGAKDAVVAGFNTALEGVKGTIDQLKAKIPGVSAENKDALNSAISGLESKFTAAKNKIADLKNATGDFSGLKDEITSMIDGLKTAAKDAASKFLK